MIHDCLVRFDYWFSVVTVIFLTLSAVTVPQAFMSQVFEVASPRTVVEVRAEFELSRRDKRNTVAEHAELSISETTTSLTRKVVPVTYSCDREVLTPVSQDDVAATP